MQFLLSLIVYRIYNYRKYDIININDKVSYYLKISSDLNKIFVECESIVTTFNHIATLYVNNNNILGTWWDYIPIELQNDHISNIIQNLLQYFIIYNHKKK